MTTQTQNINGIDLESLGQLVEQIKNDKTKRFLPVQSGHGLEGSDAQRDTREILFRGWLKSRVSFRL